MGQAYESQSFHSKSMVVSIPSGYTYYYMPLTFGGTIGGVSISYAESRRDMDVDYVRMTMQNDAVSYQNSSSNSSYDTYSSMTFSYITGALSGVSEGYIVWRIVPYGNGYACRVCLFMGHSNRWYYGYNRSDLVYTLNQCTPTQITISGYGSSSYLKDGTGVTIYGIK